MSTNDRPPIHVLRPTEESDAPVTIKRKDWSECPHVTGWEGQAVIDEDAGTVTCRECGAVLDPFVVLIAIANHYRRRIEGPLRELRVANATHNENERGKFMRRVERHRSRHPKFVGTCRTCNSLNEEAPRWSVARFDEVRG